MNVLILVVNYRTAELTIDCLASLEPEIEGIAPSRVIVVDNDSGDGSFEKIASAVMGNNWGSWATVIRAGSNGGFASGNNIGLSHALSRWPAPRYVHLLNPDTVVRPGAVRELVSFMDAHPTAGIAGSRLEDPDGTPQRSAFRFPSALGELEATARIGVVSRLLSSWRVAPPVATYASQTDWVAGASMIIRRQVIDAIGRLDERYFMYFEEVDFIARARASGWSCWYVPESRVVHLVGRSSGVTDRAHARRRRPAYWFESRRRYMMEHLGRPGAALADLAFVAGSIGWRLRRTVLREVDDTPEHLLSDLARHSALHPSSAAERAGIARGPGLIEQIVEDWKAHDRDWTRPGFQAMAIHRFGNWRMRIRPRAVRAPMSAVYRALFRGARNFYGIELPYTARVGRRVVIEHQSGIVVHGNARIGDDCVLRQGVTIGNRTMTEPLSAPTLGARVNVGAGAKILGAITVGDGAQVGANSVVLRDVPAGGLAVGVPARILPARDQREAGAPSVRGVPKLDSVVSVEAPVESLAENVSIARGFALRATGRRR